jgi:DNA-binding SARP family transcriptional activator
MAQPNAVNIAFRILGPLTVVHEGRDLTPTAPKIRQVLAFLLMRRNQLVQVTELIDELWGENPPNSAMTTLQTYIYKLRKDIIDQSSLGRVRTKPSGYLLEVDDRQIDACDFERLAADGRHALENDDPQTASKLLTEALALWHGQVLVGVTAGDILSAYVTRLDEERLRALELRIEADLRLGHHQELVSELKMMTFTHPLHERFHANLMTALHRSGRRYEALDVYRRLRMLLINELGLEPSTSVQRLHQSLLAADASEPGAAEPIELPMADPVQVMPYLPATAVPAQLSPDSSDFTGRHKMLSRLRRTIIADDQRTTAQVVAISGMPGVGKTTLALRAAHLERAHFPDGQLFADLRGSTGRPAAAKDVLAGFLRAVGLQDHGAVPSGQEEAERAKLFRTWTNDRRYLIVLDDADSAAQVMPLLPSSPGSAVIVTSSWRLHSLSGAHMIGLDVMNLDEGLELLGRIIGPERVAAERQSAETVVDATGRLPLAIRSVGARLAANPAWSLSRLAEEIRSGPVPLDEFRFAEYDVRARYDSSYSQLDAGERSTLRLLSLLPAHEFSADTVAGLVGNAADVVEDQFSRLVGCHLLEVASDAMSDRPRYRLHKLSRLYARERLDREFIRPQTPAG